MKEAINSSRVYAKLQESKKKSLKVCVTGAAGNIGYAIVFMVAQGNMLGPNQPVELRLLDIPGTEKQLKGLVMELEDGAYPLLTRIIPTTSYETAFTDVEIVLAIGAKPRGPGMERSDLLKANAPIFAGQGKAFNSFASRSVKVLVVGNPANTNALIALSNAPNLNPNCFAALTRLDQARAESMLAQHLRTSVEKIHNVTIWGNHSATQYTDVSNAFVSDYPTCGTSLPVRAAVNDDQWLTGALISAVANRGAAIIEARKASSAASAAAATVACMRDWVLGTRPGTWVNMAILSDGSYGVPQGIVYSFPVTIVGGKVQIVQGLSISPETKKGMIKTADELIQEKVAAFS